MNPISLGKLDSPAFSNSCSRAAASMGRWRGWRGRAGRRKEGKREDKSMQGESRGRLRPLSHRQTAINKSIGNCGWLENGLGGWRMEKERGLNQSSSTMDGARRGRLRRRRRGGRERGFDRGGGVQSRKVVLVGVWKKRKKGKEVEVQKATGVPSPSFWKHILLWWCSDWAWHCAVPRCGLPNEPSEARLYLGQGEGLWAPSARWVQLGWLAAGLTACLPAAWLPGHRSQWVGEYSWTHTESWG